MDERGDDDNFPTSLVVGIILLLLFGALFVTGWLWQ